MIEIGSLRRLAESAKALPIHPQWLLRNDRGGMLGSVADLRGRVVDVGCADRWLSRVLHPEVHYIALDYPTTGAVLYGARPDLFADASALPIKDGAVDAVVMLEVAEHLANPTGAFHEAFRALRPGGVLVVSVPFCYPIHDAPHDFRRWTPHGLVRDLESAGFDIPEAPTPRLHAVESAALLACLALSGSLAEAMRRHMLGALMLPVVVPLVLSINLGGWLMARLLPSWMAMTNGYVVRAVRPAADVGGESDGG